MLGVQLRAEELQVRAVEGQVPEGAFTGPDKLLPWVETIGLEGWRNDVALCTRNLLINPVVANVNALLQAWINVEDVDSEMVYMPRHFTRTVALVREQVFGAPFPADVLHAMTANMGGKPAKFLGYLGVESADDYRWLAQKLNVAVDNVVYLACETCQGIGCPNTMVRDLTRTNESG